MKRSLWSVFTGDMNVLACDPSCVTCENMSSLMGNATPGRLSHTMTTLATLPAKCPFSATLSFHWMTTSRSSRVDLIFRPIRLKNPVPCCTRLSGWTPTLLDMVSLNIWLMVVSSFLPYDRPRCPVMGLWYLRRLYIGARPNGEYLPLALARPQYAALKGFMLPMMRLTNAGLTLIRGILK